MKCAAFECWSCKKPSLSIPFACRPDGDRTPWKCPHCGVSEIGGNSNTLNQCLAILDNGIGFTWEEEIERGQG